VARRRRREVVVDVDLGEPLLADLRERETEREERALALLPTGDRGARVGRSGRNALVEKPASAAVAPLPVPAPVP
jgi:hypothetical protein